MVDEWLEYLRNDTDKVKPKYWKKTLFRCQFIDYKSHLNLPGIDPGPPRRQSSYVLPKNVNIEFRRAVNFIVVLYGCVCLSH
jgi:hypothetical protein